MTIDFQKAYKFNLETNRAIEVPIPEEENDFSEYIGQLIEDVVGDARSKKYLFPSEETTTKSDMEIILTGDEADAVTAAKRFATRLKNEENRVQGRIEHLNKEVQRGMMIVTAVTMGEARYFLIIKAEHFDFIDEGSRRKATGLPIKKKIFKAFCAHLDDNDEPQYAMVSDSRAVISTYWWQNYLELEEEYTDEHNTVKSFDVLDKKIFKPMQEQSPRDYMFLRNATVAYYRANEEFVLDDYVRRVIERYEPEGTGVDIERVAERIRNLPESGGFNTRFRVVREKLTKRIITRLKLSPQLDLVIKENINWGTAVESVIENGIKYIRIRTNAGYDHFKLV
jgi:hypothetical protein